VLLKENVRRNGYSNVTIVEAALADRSGPTQLHLSDPDSGDHRIEAPQDPRRTIDIEAIALDDYFGDDSPPVDLIKLDIQGAEWRALHGMKGVIRRSPSLAMVLELFPVGLAATVSSRDFLAYLGERFDQVYDLDWPGRVIAPADTKHLLTRYTVENGLHTNLLWVEPKGARPRASSSAE
jgi:FkbM family methyltransferase